MTASRPDPDPPLVRALKEVREVLERTRRNPDVRDIEPALERINLALDRMEQ